MKHEKRDYDDYDNNDNDDDDNGKGLSKSLNTIQHIGTKKGVCRSIRLQRIVFLLPLQKQTYP